jgi:hypothetical protein
VKLTLALFVVASAVPEVNSSQSPWASEVVEIVTELEEVVPSKQVAEVDDLAQASEFAVDAAASTPLRRLVSVNAVQVPVVNVAQCRLRT